MSSTDGALRATACARSLRVGDMPSALATKTERAAIIQEELCVATLGGFIAQQLADGRMRKW